MPSNTFFLGIAGRGDCSVQEFEKGFVRLAIVHFLQNSINLVEKLARTQSVIDAPAVTFDFLGLFSGFLQWLPNFGWKSMDEFRTEFNRMSGTGIHLRPDPSSNSFPSLQQQHRQTTLTQPRSSSQAGDTGSNHYDVRL